MLVVGAIGGWILGQIYAPRTRGTLLREGQGQFTNRLLACEIADQKEFAEFYPLEKKIEASVISHIREGSASTISVYFRALNSGRWVAVNENELFEPASLLKVPILIAYYQLVDSQPEILKKQLVFTGSEKNEFRANISPSETLVVGKSYSIEELLRKMVEYSDNDARTLLVKNMDPAALYEVFTDLGISLSKDAHTQDIVMSAKTYGSFFRILYSVTYLSKNMSERALKLLSNTKFTGGLVAGVPKNITVSHKFGERIEDNTKHELHDCGIIYYPAHPYLLCIMTRGSDFKKLESTIADISRLVYKEAETSLFKN